MLHIRVAYLGDSPDRRHAFISSNVGKLLTEHPGTNLSEIQMRILTSVSFKKMRMKVTSEKTYACVRGRMRTVTLCWFI